MVAPRSFPSKFAKHLYELVYAGRRVIHARQILPLLSRLDSSCIGVSSFEASARYFEYVFSTFFVARYKAVTQQPQDLIAMYIPLYPLKMHHQPQLETRVGWNSPDLYRLFQFISKLLVVGLRLVQRVFVSRMIVAVYDAENLLPFTRLLTQIKSEFDYLKRCSAVVAVADLDVRRS